MQTTNFEIISANLKFHAPYTHRVVLLCLEKEISFHINPINLEDKPDWFLKISPSGEVPVMRTNDEFFTDSFTIASYLDQLSTPHWIPQTSDSSYANFFELLTEINAFGKELVTFVRRCSYDIHHFRLLFSYLQKFDSILHDNIYLSAESPTYSDLALLPHILQIECFDENIFPFSLLYKVPSLQCWLLRMKSRVSVQNSSQNFAQGFIEHLQHRGFYAKLMTTID